MSDSSSDEPRRDRVGLGLFLGYSILAGGNAVGVRISNQELEPLWGATLRFALAAILMVAVALAMGRRVPRGSALIGPSLYGLLAFGGAFALAFYALVELEAGFAQILLAVVPLLTVLLAAVQRIERLRVPAVVGALAALAGVVIMSGSNLDGPLPKLPLLALLGSALCFSQAAIVVRRFPPMDPLMMNAVGLTVGTLFLAVLTAIAGSTVVAPSQTDTWWALAYMVIIGSGVVFSLWVAVVERWSATRANYGFVVIPIFTVLASAWILDEPITIGLAFGGVLVLAGVYYGALHRVSG